MDYRRPCVHERIFNLQVSTNVLKTGFGRRRRLVGGLELENMGIATVNMLLSVTDSNCLAPC